MPWVTPPRIWPSTIGGVHRHAAVLDHHVALDLDEAGLDVDVDDAAVRATRPALLAAVEVAA